MRVPLILIIRRSLLTILIAVFLTILVCGQNDNEIVVKSDLIQTNVVVTDKDGKFVEGLKPEQFLLKIDGKPTPIEFFEGKFSSVQNQPETSKKSPRNREINPVTSLKERKIIFFLDDFHLSLDSLGRTRSALKHFIDYDMLPKDNVLILTASDQLGFFQQFTDNKSVLHTAVERIRTVPNLSKDNEQPPMPEYIAVRINRGEREVADFYVQKIIEGYNAKNINGINKNAAYEMVKQRANHIVTSMANISNSTLFSLQKLLQIAGQINGQKMVFFVSDGFYLDSKFGGLGANNYFLRVLDEATRTGSRIYTIDARGLFSLAADATNERPVDVYGAMKSKGSEDTAAQDGLFALANETGGRFLRNQNYFDKWIEKTLDENSSYYVIAWTPEEENQTDKQFKKVEVVIAERPELKVRLQQGYLADRKQNSPENKRDKSKAEEDKTFSGVADEQKKLKTKLSLSFVDVPGKGEVLTSSVQISTGGLKSGADSKQPAIIDLAGLVFDSSGKKVAEFNTGLNINPPADSSAENGQSIIYNDRKPLAPGLYQVKIGVKERQTGAVGRAAQWIEIPDLSKKQLMLGSLFLGMQEIKNQNEAKETSSQVQFSVDNTFRRPLKLSFLTFVYNALKLKTDETAVNLATQIEVFDARGKKIIDSLMKPLAVTGNEDITRIPVSGAIRQGTFSPGDYLLRVTVTDRQANSTAVQQTIFTVE